MEPLENRGSAPCKALAPSRHSTDEGSAHSASESNQAQGLDLHQYSSRSSSTSARARRARPGAHFQPPQASPRSPLVHCNTLFLPSTLQAPQGLQQARLENPQAPVGLRRQVPRSDAYLGSDGHQQSRSNVADSFREVGLPRTDLRSVSRLGREADVDIRDHDAHVRHTASERCRGSPSRLAPHKTLADVSPGSAPLLPAAPYLQAFKRLKMATSGRRVASAGRNADISMKGAPPLKIFCGTWNCQYQEFPVSVLTNQATASRVRGGQDSTGPAAIHASSLSPQPQAAECLLPEEVPAEVIAKLDGDFESLYDSDTGQLEGTDVAESNGQETSQGSIPHVEVHTITRRGTIKRNDLVRSSTRQLRAVEGEDQPLGDWLLPGYDIYVVSLQETLGQSIFDTVTVYLTTTNGVQFKRIKFQEDKLSGLGDGAWMQFKSTSLAVWAREDLEGEGMPVSLVGSKAASVSFLSGSKGGVSVCLKIWDQFFCFIGCHMPSTSPEDRRKARAVIEQRLLEYYGGAASWRGAFHHVLWMGDFNFRTQRVTTQRAVSLLKQSPAGLLAFDEWVGPNGEDMRTAGFVEAPISFPPTYKKADGRPPVNMSHPKWVEEEYQTHMVTQWYKGSRHQDRIPSWTDRIFKCSVAELSPLVRFQPSLYFSALPSRPSFLIASDHSPVGLGIECFPLDAAYVLPLVTSDASPNKKIIISEKSPTMRAGETFNDRMFLDS